jgi:hypothetical protein
MELSETDGSDARIRALENKIQDLEPLVRGLIEETLDLKSVYLSHIKEAEEFRRQERERETTVRSTVSPIPVVLTAPPVQAMVPIMQADGTMKMEPRSGDRNQTDSTAGYGPTRKANLSRANRNL